MDNFYVTKLVTKLGYYVLGFGTIGLSALLLGVIMKSFWAFLGGALLGAVAAIPLLLVCEFSYAIVKIAENTSPQASRDRDRLHDRAA